MARSHEVEPDGPSCGDWRKPTAGEQPGRVRYGYGTDLSQSVSASPHAGSEERRRQTQNPSCRRAVLHRLRDPRADAMSQSRWAQLSGDGAVFSQGAREAAQPAPMSLPAYRSAAIIAAPATPGNGRRQLTSRGRPRPRAAK